jgi:hypothetical protein
MDIAMPGRGGIDAIEHISPPSTQDASRSTPSTGEAYARGEGED